MGNALLGVGQVCADRVILYREFEGRCPSL
jgi:hypothetical protein